MARIRNNICILFALSLAVSYDYSPVKCEPKPISFARVPSNEVLEEAFEVAKTLW